MAGIASGRPTKIMGILNVSPESFYKGSIKTSKVQIRDAAKRMEDEGADLVDIGGASTAPYLKTAIPGSLEAARVVGAIKIVQNHTNLPISVDTCRGSVAKSALELGISMINDVSGLQYDPGMKSVLSEHCPYVILGAFDKKPAAGNLVTKTRRLLERSIKIAAGAGIPARQVILDPSIGFFRKGSRGHVFTKIASDWTSRDISAIKNLKAIKGRFPIMVSVSNKSFIGSIISRDDPADRLFGSIAAEAAAVIYGADMIRTHNVAATRDAVLVASRFRN